MTQLLVSVRDAAEARAVLAGGADIIDVKEPAAGPLGRAAPEVWRSVLDAVAGTAPVSVALGELAEAECLPVPPSGVAWAKVGLAGEKQRPDWPRRLQDLAERLRPVPLIAAAYADWRRAGAPSIEAVLQAAMAGTLAGLLIDTWQKDERRLLDWMPTSEVAALQARVPQEMTLALAGRLRLRDIRRLSPLRPAVIAVRGLACRGSDRMDGIDVRRVAVLKRRLFLGPRWLMRDGSCVASA